MASGRDPRPLKWCSFKQVDTLCRCLHLAEAIQSSKNGHFSPRSLTSNNTTGMNIKVLWYSSAKKIDENNKYGNVSHLIPLKVLLKRFQGNFYYVNQLVFKSHTSTRILLTRRNLDSHLQRLNVSVYGSPLKLNPTDGKYYEVVKCLNSKNELYPHETEIGVEPNENDLVWLYHNSSVRPNNHSLANKPRPADAEVTCFHYNYRGKNCPSSLIPEDTMKILWQKCPELMQNQLEQNWSSSDEEESFRTLSERESETESVATGRESDLDSYQSCKFEKESQFDESEYDFDEEDTENSIGRSSSCSSWVDLGENCRDIEDSDEAEDLFSN